MGLVEERNKLLERMYKLRDNMIDESIKRNCMIRELNSEIDKLEKEKKGAEKRGWK